MRSRQQHRRSLLILPLLIAGCTVPPIVFHDGLPAWTPEDDYPAVRAGAQWLNWYERDEVFGFPSFHGGFRVGQHAGPVRFEEGLNLVYCGTFAPFLTVGIGLDQPLVTLRGAVAPVGAGPTFPWWQASLLAGSPRPERGVGLAAGPRIGSLGAGGALLVDWNNGNSVIRTELSGTGRAPWSDSSVSGTVITVGFWYEYRAHNRVQAATATRRPPR